MGMYDKEIVSFMSNNGSKPIPDEDPGCANGYKLTNPITFSVDNGLGNFL